MSLESDEAEGRLGSVLNGKWTLQRLLGVGGMGAVYAGVHRNGACAAVKVLHRSLSRQENVRSRFLREGYVSNRIDRSGVVKVLDDDIVRGGLDDGTAYLVMELLSGQSLDQRARVAPVTEREFLAVADAVLDVLEGAHGSGIVHRDIKPENVFLARDESGAGRVKLLDFGLARLLEGPSFTSYGIAIGTPSFMAPEQAAGKNSEIDGRTDLFALAASGFLLLTGRRIHEGFHPHDRVAKMASLPAPPIRSVAPEISGEVARVLDRALEFRRESRHENATAMRADVRQALASLGGAATDLPTVAAHDRTVELSARDFLAPSDASGPATVPREKTVELSARDFLPSTGGAPPVTSSASPPPRVASAPPPPAPVPPPPITPLPPTVEMLPWVDPAVPVPWTDERATRVRKRNLRVPVILGIMGLSVGAVLAMTVDPSDPLPSRRVAPRAATRGSLPSSEVSDATADAGAPTRGAAPKRRLP